MYVQTVTQKGFVDLRNVYERELIEQRLAQILNRALIEKVNILIFPELSIDQAAFDWITNWLKNENYSEDHSFSQTISSQIIQAQNEITGRLDEFQHQLLTNFNLAEQNITADQRNLRSLPRNEIRLAELERNRQIKENILTNTK